MHPILLTASRAWLKFPRHIQNASLGRLCICLSGNSRKPESGRKRDEMPKREHTIIFVPHAKARFRQFRVSSRLLWSLGAAFLTSVLLGATFSVLWVRSINRSREVSAILAENSDLRSRAASTNARLESLEKQLAEFEDRTRRLSIVAGLSAVRDPGTGGVGGLTAAPIDAAASADSGLREASRRGALALFAPSARREPSRDAGRPARPHPDDRSRRRRPDRRLRPEARSVHRP